MKIDGRWMREPAFDAGKRRLPLAVFFTLVAAVGVYSVLDFPLIFLVILFAILFVVRLLALFIGIGNGYVLHEKGSRRSLISYFMLRAKFV